LHLNFEPGTPQECYSFTKICCISHQVRPGKAKRCEVCSLLADISREDVESQPVDLTNNF
jgi:hypothetical protein